MERKKDFLLRTATVENPQDAPSQMNGKSGEIISINRAALQSIMKLTMLFGQQNISFRGHRNDGEMLSKPDYNDGNFRTFVRYTVEAGDEQLREHQKIPQKMSATFRKQPKMRFLISQPTL